MFSISNHPFLLLLMILVFFFFFFTWPDNNIIVSVCSTHQCSPIMFSFFFINLSSLHTSHSCSCTEPQQWKQKKIENSGQQTWKSFLLLMLCSWPSELGTSFDFPPQSVHCQWACLTNISSTNNITCKPERHHHSDITVNTWGDTVLQWLSLSHHSQHATDLNQLADCVGFACSPCACVLWDFRVPHTAQGLCQLITLN